MCVYNEVFKHYLEEFEQDSLGSKTLADRISRPIIASKESVSYNFFLSTTFICLFFSTGRPDRPIHPGDVELLRHQMAREYDVMRNLANPYLSEVRLYFYTYI